MGFKEWIIPQDKVFYSLIEKESKMVLEGANVMSEIMENSKNIKELREELKKIEEKGDSVVREIHQRLNRTFITPIDHEDISKLASLYDDVLDHIWATVNKMYLFKVTKVTPEMKKFAKIILKSIEEINHAFKYMKKMDQEEIEKQSEKVHSLENEGDVLLNNSYARLFKEKNPVSIIIMKEVYEYLETILDESEDVCNVIQNIVIKNA